MSDPVERAGRAIFESLYGDTHTGGWVAYTADVNISEAQKDRFRMMGRAAIAEVFDWLAEPSAQAAGHGAEHLFGAANEDWSEDARAVFTAMLSTLRHEALGTPLTPPTK